MVMSLESDLLAGWLTDLGVMATALAAVFGVVYAAWRVARRWLEEHVVKPLLPNGGKSLGDMPRKLDALIARVDELDERTRIMHHIVSDRRRWVREEDGGRG